MLAPCGPREGARQKSGTASAYLQRRRRRPRLPLRFRCLGCEHFSTDVSYLPDLEARLAHLLRGRERLMSAFEADNWARAQAMPAEEEIRRVRRLIERVTSDIDDLTPEDRAQIEQAVSVLRRSRTVLLGMPHAGHPLPDVRPPRTPRDHRAERRPPRRAAREPTGPAPATGPAVTQASLDSA